MIGSLLLLALAVVGPPAPAEAEVQIVRLGWDVGSKSCNAAVNGVETGDPRSDDGAAALIRALPDARRVVHLNGTIGLPYMCVDGVVTALQKSGRGYRVGFISEPPGPSAPRE